MKLSDRYQYWILCEDKQTQCFIRSFLGELGIPPRKISYVPLPVSGCGEQYVREQYPEELRKLRSANYNRLVLLVCTDADIRTVQDVEKGLHISCEKKNIAQRTSKECVAFVIPKRNIETWIVAAEVGDGNVNETDDYGHYSGMERVKGRRGADIAKYISDRDESLIKLASLQYLQKEVVRLSRLAA